MRRGICGAVAAVAALFVYAPSASAAVTIGSDLSKPVEFGGGCTSCTDVPRTIPGRLTTAPFDGVVVRWNIKKGPANWGTATLRVMREASSDPLTYLGAGTSAAEIVPLAEGTHSFSTRLPIRAGDYIGIEASNQVQGAFNEPGVVEHFVAPPPPDGGPPSGVVDSADEEVFFNAEIEPDADCDGFGDETQDPSVIPPGACPQPEPALQTNRSITLDANKSKVKRGKKVTLSGRLTVAAGQGPCDAGQAVELQRKRPKLTTFTTFAQVQSDAQGGFSLKKKLKKTFEFRAQVLETAACTAALSDSERVKVKKKR